MPEDGESRTRFEVLYGSISDEEAIRVQCPTCDAEPAAPCTYVPPPILINGPTRSRTYRAAVARAGKPTRRAHNTRRRVAHAERLRVWRRRNARPSVVVGSPELRAASLAMRAWDLREHLALASWIRSYGDILIGGS